MHVITEKLLKEFWKDYPDSKTSLRSWYKKVNKAHWNNSEDIKKTISNKIDIVDIFTIFDMGGNKYRLITFIDYQSGKIFIRDILPHKEYDKNKWRKDAWNN